jgi:hypothetical protein
LQLALLVFRAADLRVLRLLHVEPHPLLREGTAPAGAVRVSLNTA